MDGQARPETERDARLVEAVREGHKDAFAQLVEAWFDRCWEVSWRILHDRDRAAEVTQDVMLAAWQKLDTLTAPGSFGGWVLRMSRNRSLDRLAHEQRMLPPDEVWMLEPADTAASLGDPEQEAQRREAHDLVWHAAAALGERDASILDLHLRHGLEAKDLADELGIEPNAANQALHRMRGRLGTAIRARLLWHRGSPRCTELAAELAAARIEEFGPQLVRVIDRHAKACDACARQQRTLTSPVALFAAVPLVAVAPSLRAASAQALAAQGVPVPSSWAAGSGGAHSVDAPSVDAPSVDAPSVDAPSADAHSAGPPPSPGSSNGGAPKTDAAASGAADAMQSEATSPLTGARRATRGRTLSRGAIALIVVAAVLLLAGGIAAVSLGLGAASTPATTATPTPTPPSMTPTPTPPPTPRPTPTPSATPTTSVPTDPPEKEPPPALPVPTVEVSAGWVGVAGCPTETPFLYRIRWSTTDADAVRLSGTWGSDEVALSGEAERCGEMTAQFTLTATGPGGETIATVDAEATPAA